MEKTVCINFVGGSLDGRAFSSALPADLWTALMCYKLTENGAIGRKFTIRPTDPIPGPFQRRPITAHGEEVYQVVKSLDWGNDVSVFVQCVTP